MNRSWISDSSTQVGGGSADDRPHVVAPWVVADAVLRDLFVSTMLISPILVRVRCR